MVIKREGNVEAHQKDQALTIWYTLIPRLTIADGATSMKHWERLDGSARLMSLVLLVAENFAVDVAFSRRKRRSKSDVNANSFGVVASVARNV